MLEASKMGTRDFLVEVGTIGWVTRIKRISDMMLHDGRRVYKQFGLDIEPNWFAVFMLLDRKGKLPVMQIADELSLSHPSVIAIIQKMTKAGYLIDSKEPGDNRMRLISLSRKAKRKLPEFERIWAAGTAAYKRIFADVDVVRFLEGVEKAYRESSFEKRAVSEIKHAEQVEIVAFRKALAKYFAELNYEWIAKSYGIEEHDREILDAPYESIIKPGGQIFFALVKEKVAGTVALENLTRENFELVKMAVSPEYRGLGIGDRLIEACIEFAKRKRKKSITLDSNTKQLAAINLYRKYGFKEVPIDPNSPYTRVNIRMELALNNGNM